MNVIPEFSSISSIYPVEERVGKINQKTSFIYSFQTSLTCRRVDPIVSTKMIKSDVISSG